ncbi:MAG: OFA family MFS transporter [Pirellulales bacterium]|nr:OFA family MFS transporter [Pirellulales bacterium]
MKRDATIDHSVRNLGWRVTFAGLGINLALGVLYTWSVISKAIPAEWGWKEADRSWPYAIACLVFSLTMVPAGRLQDKLGPRLVASVGGLLVGLGMILASTTTEYPFYVLYFGILAGAGFGFGYASATPPAVKWFPASRTGLIAGLVVSGFGLASVYAAPLASKLIALYGLSETMKILGIAFLIVVVGLAQLLTPPPKGYVPAGTPSGASAGIARKEDFSPMEMLRTGQFYLLWFMYACGAGAGLMIIAKLAKIGAEQVSITQGFVLVAACAVGNGAGRILAGMASDKLGRQKTMLGCFLMQAILMLVLSRAATGTPLASLAVMMLISALIGANYGANLSLFPSITKDYYGLKNFGVNYGLIFTAWGVGGLALSLLAGKLYDINKSFEYAYYTAAGLLVLAALTTFAVKTPHAHHEGA